ncbi:hypothetical protein J6590_063708 [Homalodisca vitripennis]|nr:hypothetical protein J6590_063708 [Homalodisca vitripennis]
MALGTCGCPSISLHPHNAPLIPQNAINDGTSPTGELLSKMPCMEQRFFMSDVHLLATNNER